jgi:excisionase family DNA binding protein
MEGPSDLGLPSSIDNDLAAVMWLTVEQIAIIIRISPSTVRRRIKDGTIRSVKLGRLVRIHPDEIGRLARLDRSPLYK